MGILWDTWKKFSASSARLFSPLVLSPWLPHHHHHPDGMKLSQSNGRDSSTVPRSFDTFAATTFCYANYSRLPSLDACQISPRSKQNIKQAWTSERTVKRPSTVGAFARNPSLPQTGLKQRPQFGAVAKIPRLSVAIYDHPLITCFILFYFFPRLEAFCQSLFVHLLGQYRLPHCYSHSYAGPCRIKFKRLSNRLLCILAACSKIVAHSCRFLTVYDPRVT